MSELTTGQMIDQMYIILKNRPARSGIPRDARVIYCDVLQAWGERLKLIEDIDPSRLRELAEAEKDGRVVVLKELFTTPRGDHGFIYYNEHNLLMGQFYPTEAEAREKLAALAEPNNNASDAGKGE